MLSIVTPNVDRTLLTAEELRTAVGLESSDSSHDVLLTTLGLRAAATITRACKIASGGVTAPTMRLEAVADTFRLKSRQTALVLSRRPVASISAITESGTALTDVDYELDAVSGILRRISGEVETCWPCGVIAVAYSAGWEIVPDDLKAIAAQLVSTYWSGDDLDPMEKSFSIPGVISTERWVDAGADGILPKDILAALDRAGYINTWFA